MYSSIKRTALDLYNAVIMIAAIIVPQSVLARNGPTKVNNAAFCPIIMDAIG